MQKFFGVSAFLLLFAFGKKELSTPVFPAATSVTTTAVTGKLTRINFEDSVRALYAAVKLDTYNLTVDAFRHALVGYHHLLLEGKLNNKDLLTIIDFNKPSTEKRFYTIDLKNKEVLFHELVSHGKNTGENYAAKFSNAQNSNQSSLGFYVTGETYMGSKGYSLRLDGFETGINDNMRARGVVIHAAPYVSEKWIKQYGRLGRSQGCPALPEQVNRKIIDVIKDKTVVFAYYTDRRYLTASPYLKEDALFAKLEVREKIEPVNG